MASNINISNLDIVFNQMKDKQIEKISQELLNASITELDVKWEKWIAVCGKYQNISIDKQTIVKFLHRLIELKHKTGREISKDLNDLYLSAKSEYEYLKKYSELAGYDKSPQTKMENRNAKDVPKAVSEEEKMLTAQRGYKNNSLSKRQKSNENNDQSDLNNIPGPYITEEQGPDTEAPTSTARNTQRSPVVVKSTIPSKPPSRSEMVSARDTCGETGNLEACLTDNMVQITTLSKNSGPAEISEVYQSVYTNEWNKIFSSVRKENSERHSIEFLKETLKLSYHTSVENANSQIELMMKEAMDVVRGETSPTDNANIQGNVKLLKEYRRMNSTLSLPYLKQKFFKIHLPSLQQKYSIPRDPVTSKNLHIFVSKCVEVTWFACIHDPYMVLDFDFEPKNEKELNQAVTAFKTGQKGKRLQYIVWPPLRLYKNGSVISKGVAVPK